MSSPFFGPRRLFCPCAFRRYRTGCGTHYGMLKNILQVVASGVSARRIYGFCGRWDVPAPAQHLLLGGDRRRYCVWAPKRGQGPAVVRSTCGRLTHWWHTQSPDTAGLGLVKAAQELRTARFEAGFAAMAPRLYLVAELIVSARERVLNRLRHDSCMSIA